MDRYNNYFQCVIFVLAVTIGHTDTPTTEDTHSIETESKRSSMRALSVRERERSLKAKKMWLPIHPRNLSVT